MATVTRCKCSDPGCPAHPERSRCYKRATETVRRIDMDDGTTTFDFCGPCADDALESAVFDFVED